MFFNSYPILQLFFRFLLELLHQTDPASVHLCIFIWNFWHLAAASLITGLVFFLRLISYLTVMLPLISPDMDRMDPIKMVGLKPFQVSESKSRNHLSVLEVPRKVRHLRGCSLSDQMTSRHLLYTLCCRLTCNQWDLARTKPISAEHHNVYILPLF